MAIDVESARELIGRGDVVVSGAPTDNPTRLVAVGESVHVVGPPARFVGRGGDKLAAALERFHISLRGRRVLDVGSSTGGFTDCALQGGAASVVAVDVGRGQLHQRLRTDPRVEVHERTNVRHLDPGDLGPAADAAVADVSFISIDAVIDPVLGLVRPGADLVWLVKPQFEAARHEVSRSAGVITDPAIWARVLAATCATFEGRGAAIMGLMTSPLRGADGNVEFLLHARAPGPDAGGSTVDASLTSTSTEALVQAALAEIPPR